MTRYLALKSKKQKNFFAADYFI